jgi:hypothetical protein
MWETWLMCESEMSSVIWPTHIVHVINKMKIIQFHHMSWHGASQTQTMRGNEQNCKMHDLTWTFSWLVPQWLKDSVIERHKLPIGLICQILWTILHHSLHWGCQLCVPICVAWPLSKYHLTDCSTYWDGWSSPKHQMKFSHINQIALSGWIHTHWEIISFQVSEYWSSELWASAGKW